jgi:hypothetical protein
MDTLAVSALAPTTLNAVNSLWSASLTVNPDPKPFSVNDLVQTRLQQTIQQAASSPLAAPASGVIQMAQEATASLLASLSAPQAPAAPTLTPDATTNPSAVQSPSTTDLATTTSALTSTTSLVNDVPTAQDTFDTSSTGDFAMQTAMRFGAGVAGMSAPATANSDQGTGLVRDATAVLRTSNVQPHQGGPGPDAFFHSPTNFDRVLRDYQTAAPSQPLTGLDLVV